KLTPWPHDLLKNWGELTDVEKKLFIRQADVYAAYLAYVDHEIGRVIQKIEDLGKLDDTLIIFITGDNGCSAEGLARRTRCWGSTASCCRPKSRCPFTTGGELTRPTRTSPSGGPGRLTRRTNGRSRFPPSSAARGKGQSSHGRRASRTRAAFAGSSIT